MASTNQSPFYQRAEQEFLQAETTEQKIRCLKKMISLAPSHKGAENLRKQLKRRLARLKYANEKQAKSGKSKKSGIKKSEMQAILCGLPNTGKSSIFNTLTKQKTKTASTPFTTYEPKLGTINFEDTKIQLIDMPPFPNHDQGLINSTDTLLITINNIDQIRESLKYIEKSDAKKIFIFNKIDLLNEKEKRKIQATLKSKKLNFILFSAVNPQTLGDYGKEGESERFGFDKFTQQRVGGRDFKTKSRVRRESEKVGAKEDIISKTNLEELKQKIFQSFPIIRIYTKEPHKLATKEPMILKQDSTVEEVAEKILKGMSKKIKKTKIWGPSSKFAGQPVGLEHILKDKDTIEMQIR